MLRQEILEKNEFPLVFQAGLEPGKTIGISWCLEKQGLRPLYFLLRQDVSAIGPHGANPQDVARIEAEIVGVYRLLKQAVKDNAMTH